MRGELPLPPGAAPWTPYVALDPPRTSTGNELFSQQPCGRGPHQIKIPAKIAGQILRTWDTWKAE